MRVVLCAPCRVPPGLRSPGFVAPSHRFVPLVSVRLCRAALAGLCWPPTALGPQVTLGRHCCGQRPCGACGPHIPGLLGLLYSVPVDNVHEGYLCGRPSDVAFLSAAGGAGGSVGVWLAGFLAPPFLGAVSSLVRTRGGGWWWGCGGVHALQRNVRAPLGGVPGVPA